MRKFVKVPIDITTGGGNQTLSPPKSDQQVTLHALTVSTESNSADILIEDEDGNDIGGKHHLGTSGAEKHRRSNMDLQYNAKGWATAPVGKGIVLVNEDDATISGVALVAYR